jgi:alkylation response protein AidB-like acyl-CoA dehydrogenase
MGKRTVNVAPSPYVLSTVKSPPINRQKCLLIVRPSAVPPYLLRVEASAWENAAAGWCLMIGASSIAILGAYLPDAAVKEIFRGPQVPRAAATLAPTGAAHQKTEGGYTLNGRWIFASGVRHSDWVAVGALVPDAQFDRPRHLMFAPPTSRARLHDNWDTVGLRGTGSCDLSLEDVFIPTAFTFDLLAGEPARGGPLYVSSFWRPSPTSMRPLRSMSPTGPLTR